MLQLILLHRPCDKMTYIKSYIRFFIDVKTMIPQSIMHVRSESLKSKAIKCVIGGCVCHKWQLCSHPIMVLLKQNEIRNRLSSAYFLNYMKASHLFLVLYKWLLTLDTYKISFWPNAHRRLLK